jgi:hypothetical protein
MDLLPVFISELEMGQEQTNGFLTSKEEEYF